MAFNSPIYPASYGYSPAFQQQAQQQMGMIWVQGRPGADNFQMAPNTNLPLWDSEAQVIYLKSTDQFGKPSIKVLDYTVREETKQSSQPVSDYVTKADMEAFMNFINDRFDQFSNSKKLIVTPQNSVPSRKIKED